VEVRSDVPLRLPFGLNEADRNHRHAIAPQHPRPALMVLASWSESSPARRCGGAAENAVCESVRQNMGKQIVSLSFQPAQNGGAFCWVLSPMLAAYSLIDVDFPYAFHPSNMRIYTQYTIG
jgi:hypothetical protein